MDGGNFFNLNDAKPNISEPIPAGTKLLVRMSYAPGGADFPNTPVNERRGQLTAAKEPSDAIYLKAEFTVLRGPFKGRKFWENMTVAGGKLDEKGHSIAAGITRGNMRSIVDAFNGLSSKDESPQAQAKRVLTNGFADFQGKVFPVKVGVEPAKGNHQAKNKLGTILTPDHKDWPKDESEFDNVSVGIAQPAKLPAVAAPAWGGTAAPAPAPSAALVPPTATVTIAAQPAVPPNGHVEQGNTGVMPAWMKQAG